MVTDPEPYPVLAVELSSFQLHWSATLRPLAAAVLNVAPDHLDWHGGMDAYAGAKGRIYAPGTIAICNADDAWSTRLAAAGRGRRRRRLHPRGAGTRATRDQRMACSPTVRSARLARRPGSRR